uniref:MD-2-related lipid-recognition domain-containing protein n=1 Tax=Anopheles minimus TaxID=112268 RepID=A0A182W0R3_9DIPT
MGMWTINVIIFVCLLNGTLSAEESNSTDTLFQERNETKPYTFKILKYICIGTPYKRSRLNYCKTVLRRNKPTLLNVSVTVPEVLNYIWVEVKVHYKFSTYQPFLIDMEQEACGYIKHRPVIPLTDYIFDTFVKSVPALSAPCPHGNRTYNIVWWLEERLTPRSIPAGEYRLDLKFVAKDNVTIFASETYVMVRRSGIIGSMIDLTMSKYIKGVGIIVLFFICCSGQCARVAEFQPDQTVNDSRPYKIKITKYLCVGAPYKRTTLHYCKTTLRRNKPAIINVSLAVPEVLNYILMSVKSYYKFSTYQPFLIDMEQEGCEYMKNRPLIPLANYVYDILQKTVPAIATPCPQGNRTYTIVWWLDEHFLPKSLPAGDYRLDIAFDAYDKVTLFAMKAFFSVRRSGVIASMLEW